MTEYNQDIKADKDKLRMDLIPPTAYTSLAAVLGYGAKKYGDNTWQNVEIERYHAALLRHYVAYLNNPDSIDEESGRKHIEHVLCNAMFLNDFQNKDKKNG